MAIPDEAAIQNVLVQYPMLLRGLAVPLGNHGGFSGARLWRVDSPAGRFCLKAWPRGETARANLTWIHGLLARVSHLPWVPHVMPTISGDTLACHNGQLWEMQSWMPGCADFSLNPNAERLRTAGRALAMLHSSWASDGISMGVCPAVVRRLHSWQTWHQLVGTGWRPVFIQPDPFAEFAHPLAELVVRRLDLVPRLLTPWLARPMPLQPCVCDIWHDHLLFTGDEITGLIDFGSVKVDQPAVDLARMLGSLVGAEPKQWDESLLAYEAVLPLAPGCKELAFDLDVTGVILAATHWLRWLYQDRRQFVNPTAVVRRLQHLTARLEGDFFASPSR